MTTRTFKTFIALMALATFELPTLSLADPASKRSLATPTYEYTYKNYVGKNGNIKVPENYRTEFVFLGSFAVPTDDARGEPKALHQVYIDRDSISYYRAHGTFPDGAMIVKELQGTTATDLTTGHASFWSKGMGWFVMIKDTKKRYPESGIWTDGWGWALIAQDAPSVTTNKDTTTCIACHTPVKNTDWLHVWAYPLLDSQDKISTLNSP